MKKIVCTVVHLIFIGTVFAQIESLAEPEWSDIAVFVNDSTHTTTLENKPHTIKASSNASTYLVGIGKTKTRIMVEGNKSNVRIPVKKNLNFLVNAGQNSVNPNSVIQIIKLETNKKNKRYYVGAEVSTFGGANGGNAETVPFSGKKHGKQSYLITIPAIDPGEYAIVINSSQNWNLFGVDVN